MVFAWCAKSKRDKKKNKLSGRQQRETVMEKMFAAKLKSIKLIIKNEEGDKHDTRYGAKRQNGIFENGGEILFVNSSGA
jgi:hypothetical protein